MKVFITGGGGFIGSHVVEAFVKHGDEVTCLLHYVSKPVVHHIPEEILLLCKFAYGNICDAAGLEQAIQASGATVVVHMAASISIPYSYQNPRDVVEANVMGTYNVLQACKNISGIEKVIITSSSEVYGTPDVIPITEENKLKPQSPYAATKVAGDALARTFYTSFGLPVVILRPFNTYGPRQSDRAVIPNVIKQTLWSDKIRIGALHPKRDFVYAPDSAEAYVTAATYYSPNMLGEVIHFGTNTAYSVQEIIDKVSEITGIKKEVEVSEFRKRPNMSEVLHLQADPKKAWDYLRWEPKTFIDRGLEQTIDYIKAHREIYDPLSYAI